MIRLNTTDHACDLNLRDSTECLLFGTDLSEPTFTNRHVKRKLIKTAILLVAFLAVGIGIFSYHAFHTPGAWIARSPANQRWAVDLVESGFQDIGVDFRVHDLTFSLFQPRYVCDLYWESRYMANEIHWSGDGTVAAVTVGFSGHTEPLYGCAYDFLQHQSLRTGSFGSPLEPSSAFASSITELLAARGGLGSVVPIPDLTKRP